MPRGTETKSVSLNTSLARRGTKYGGVSLRTIGYEFDTIPSFTEDLSLLHQIFRRTIFLVFWRNFCHSRVTGSKTTNQTRLGNHIFDTSTVDSLYLK